MQDFFKSDKWTVIRYAFFPLLMWTVVVVLFLVWNFAHIKRDTVEQAWIEANAIFEHNLAYRKWNTRHGGLYTFVTEEFQPNQYLNVEKRDLTTEGGLELTLVNPFQMTRQVYKLLNEESSVTTLNRTVSLMPVNPENTPDEWEEEALFSFEDGEDEVGEITSHDGRDFYRLVKPYNTLEGCLKCHGEQGYEVGDIRGGMSISVPMEPYYINAVKTRNNELVTHLAIWFFGVCGIMLSSVKFSDKQRKLIKSEEQFRLLAEYANDLEFWVTDDTVVFISPSCEQITGYSPQEFYETQGLLMDRVHSDDREIYLQSTRDDTGDRRATEFRIMTKDGDIKWLSQIWRPIYSDGQVMGRRVSARDITGRRKLEEQLFQAQKMQSMGQLAGGIAHDFNNFLTGTLGFGALLRKQLDKSADDNARSYLAKMTASLERAQHLTSSLLAFSRRQIITPTNVSLDSVASNIAELLQPLMGSRIELRIHCKGGEKNVWADYHQLEQVIMNLATNARDAMERKGVLTIATAAVHVDEKCAGKNEVSPGPYVQLSIQDTGSGIPADRLEHIFEPFYTTKEIGKGTGLGLAMVYGIVKQHGGFITVESKVGEGTRFTIMLPAATKSSAVEQVLTPEAGAEDAGGAGTILVCDDDETIRDMLREVLESNGYEVITAPEGETAIRKYHENRDRIDLLLLDMLMPGMSGRAIYNQIKADGADCRVLFMSGYAEDVINWKGMIDVGAQLIKKPVDIERLLAVVKEEVRKQG